jgi:hypothetical protein
MIERRILGLHEIRATKKGNQMKVSGYAGRYGVLSHLLSGGFKERIAKRAFDRILSTNPENVVATFNHDPSAVLGRTGAGTLQLRGDDKGLAFDCDLPDTTVGRDVWTSVRRGDLNSCSFAFNLGERMDEFSEEEDEVQDDEDLGLRGRRARPKVIVRTIRDFKSLHDISIVTNPAYPGTTVDARKLELVTAELRSRIEQFKAPQPPAPRVRSNKPCFEDRIEAREAAIVVARRRRLLNEALS